MKNAINWNIIVIIHETGYDRYKWNGVWNCSMLNIVKIHPRRITQIPNIESSIGVSDDPSPRSAPVEISIIPQRKYVKHTMESLSAPRCIASAESVIYMDRSW